MKPLPIDACRLPRELFRTRSEWSSLPRWYLLLVGANTVRAAERIRGHDLAHDWNDREEIPHAQAAHYPQLLDQIPIDVFARVLPSLEPVCHATATRPRLVGRRIVVLRCHLTKSPCALIGVAGIPMVGRSCNAPTRQ